MSDLVSAQIEAGGIESRARGRKGSETLRVQQDLCLPSQSHSQSLKIRGSLFPNPHIPCRLDLAPDTISEVHIDLALPGQG